MPKPVQTESSYSHIDLDTRIEIQQQLDQRVPVAAIAKKLDRSVSSIKREIDRNSEVKERSGNDCLLKKTCHNRNACPRQCNHKLCKHCKAIECCTKCTDYTISYCDRLQESPHVCNGCEKLIGNRCVMAKRIYKATAADKHYNARQRDKSNGFNMSKWELKQIEKFAVPLLKQGLSPYAVIETVGDKIHISVSTLYRMIDKGLLSARNIDLREKVSRRTRRKPKNKDATSILVIEKRGHTWADYLDYIAKNDVFTVEMDCVEGKKTDKAAILTLHWKEFHMQLYFMLDMHDAKHVVEILDRIEISLDNLELFRECFPLILTDNGHEFVDIEGIEHSCLVSGEKRTKVFFCEPNRSDQKGSAERNHRLLRDIVPKHTSVEPFMQSHMQLVSNHVNSYPRKSIGGMSPYDLGMRVLPEDFFWLLGLEKVPTDQIVLQPSLLKSKDLVTHIA